MKLKEKKDALPDEIERYLRDVVPTMQGWMEPQTKGRALARHVLDTRPIWAVEIGVFAGRSLITIALAMKHNGVGIVSGIDPWTKEESTKGFEDDPPNRDWWAKIDHSIFLNQTKDSIEQMDVSYHVALTVATSEEALRRTKEVLSSDSPVRIDLLHIDGNHSQESALFDVNGWCPLVQPGCQVWLDDKSWVSTKPAQERILDFCDLIEVISDCGIYRKK